MKYIFTFPDIGEGIHEGRIVKWYVVKGQSVRSGEALVKMETDKVVTDIPSPKDGTIVARHGGEGDLVNVGDALVEIDIVGDESMAAPNAPPSTMAVVEEKGFGVVGSLEVAGDAAYLPAGEEGRPEAVRESERKDPRKVLATPVARAMAKDLGLDITRIVGSGPAGRVMKIDISRAAESGRSTDQPAAIRLHAAAAEEAGVTVEPLTQIRKTIARNMMRSKQNAAHMTVFEQVEVDRLVTLRKRLNEKLGDQGPRLTYLPFILKAVAAALTSHPSLNARMDLDKDQMIYYHTVHINIAVDTPEGLVVPVVRDVGRKGLRQLAEEIAELAAKAQSRSLQLSDFQGGTFTVTNYGAIGGTFGVPVINYPQAAILGIGRIMKSPVVRGEVLAIGHMLPLSLSVDHRMVDGAEATRFVRDVMDILSDPETLLLL
jgi:pyruvate dehydrogenase E2 component (dihydrolipoamide acetyltransferase)